MTVFKTLFRAVPALLWYILIFSLSAQTAGQSHSVSDEVIGDVLTTGGSSYVEAVHSAQDAVEELLSFFIRKGAHMFLFFVLAMLVWLALYRLIASRPKRAGVTFVLCALLAALDEFHQSLVPGRSGELRDVLVDVAGVLIGLALFALPPLADWLNRRMAHPERLWPIGAAVGAVLLVYVGLLDGLAPMFAYRATQVNYFALMEETERAALLQECAPILRQALYLAACAVTGFFTALLSALSENRRAVAAAVSAAVLLCLLAALVWDLLLIPGALLALLAAAVALGVRAAFPLLRL